MLFAVDIIRFRLTKVAKYCITWRFFVWSLKSHQIRATRSSCACYVVVVEFFMLQLELLAFKFRSLNFHFNFLPPPSLFYFQMILRLTTEITISFRCSISLFVSSEVSQCFFVPDTNFCCWLLTVDSNLSFVALFKLRAKSIWKSTRMCILMKT